MLSLDDFAYPLPKDLIAQEPLLRRESSRLLVRTSAGTLLHRSIETLVDELPAGALLIVNDSRVFASRLWGRLEDGTSAEVFLLERPQKEGTTFKAACLAKPMKKIRRLPRLTFPEGIGGIIEEIGGSPSQTCLTLQDLPSLEDWLGRHAFVPLPPYIKREQALPWNSSPDRNRYQTVYAKETGSVAAPTAGLHFSESLLKRLSDKGVDVLPVTLHVGGGTFLPVKSQDISQHPMHSETYSIPEKTVKGLLSAREEKRLIIAVGTTSFRSVEDFFQSHDLSQADRFLNTRLFIYPRHVSDRYVSSVFSALLTNFHQPKSTLFMLICALVGFEEAHRLYREAIEERYRFFSYGDASLLWF